jgi:hypothetical protein
MKDIPLITVMAMVFTNGLSGNVTIGAFVI